MFYEIVLNLCEERGEKITPLVKKLGLSPGSIQNWKNGSAPTANVLLIFAKYFGVTTDYLITGIDNIQAVSKDLLSSNEKEWLDTIEQIPVEKHSACMAFLKTHISDLSDDDGILRIYNNIPKERKPMCKAFLETHMVEDISGQNKKNA